MIHESTHDVRLVQSLGTPEQIQRQLVAALCEPLRQKLAPPLRDVANQQQAAALRGAERANADFHVDESAVAPTVARLVAASAVGAIELQAHGRLADALVLDLRRGHPQ